MEIADEALIHALQAEVLAPPIVEHAIATVLEGLRARLGPDRLQTLRADRSQLDAQLANLTEAIKAGGSIPTLVKEMKVLQRRREGLDAELAAQDGARSRWTARGCGVTWSSG